MVVYGVRLDYSFFAKLLILKDINFLPLYNDFLNFKKYDLPQDTFYLCLTNYDIYFEISVLIYVIESFVYDYIDDKVNTSNLTTYFELH